MPWPLNTEWHWPASVSLTSRLVRISICRIFLRISRGIMSVLRHRQFIEYLLNDRLAGLLFRLGFVSDGDPMTQDIHPDGFDVLRRHVAASAQEGKSFAGQGERDGGAWRGPQLNHVLDVDFVMRRVAGGADQIDDVVLHFVINVDIVN